MVNTSYVAHVTYTHLVAYVAHVAYSCPVRCSHVSYRTVAHVINTLSLTSGYGILFFPPPFLLPFTFFGPIRAWVK